MSALEGFRDREYQQGKAGFLKWGAWEGNGATPSRLACSSITVANNRPGPSNPLRWTRDRRQA